MRLTIISVALALTAGAAQAEYFDGNKLLTDINSALPAANSFAMGYVAGVADAIYGLNYCPPQNVTLGQATDIVKALLIARPQDRHLSADRFVTQALSDAFPCPQRQQQRGSNI